MIAEIYMFTAVVLAFMLSVILGGNNFSTCLGASLGTGTVSFSSAVVIASAGVLLGTVLEGHKLSSTLQGQLLPVLPNDGLVVILASSLLVMLAVTLLRLPLALSQAMIGAGWGFALATSTPINGVYSIAIMASWALSPALAFVVSALVERIMLRVGRRSRNIFSLNRLYAILTLFAGFYAAYTLGANTLGLVVGLFSQAPFDRLLLSLAFSAGTVIGIAFLSKGTARSVAEKLVGLSPSTALSAQLGGAASAHAFTQMGLPVSISQGAIGGMGGAASVKQVAITNRRLLQQIVAGWTIGPMAGAAVAFVLAQVI